MLLLYTAHPALDKASMPKHGVVHCQGCARVYEVCEVSFLLSPLGIGLPQALGMLNDWPVSPIEGLIGPFCRYRSLFWRLAQASDLAN